MKAARLHSVGKGLEVDDVPTPRPGPGEIVVKIGGAGLCHSDLHLMDGELDILPSLPVTLGHENAGVVADLGRGVKEFREGDPVVVFGGWGCGHCDECVAGDEQLCATPRWSGLSRSEGGYAEYLLVPDARHLVPLRRLDPRDAAPLTDAALTPYRAIKKAREFLRPDQEVLVIGVGGLGQYGLQLLRVLAGCPVIAVDIAPDKRALALRLGATHVLDGRAPDLAARVLDLTRGRGVCAAFDFVGTDATLSLAIGSTRSRGKVTQLGLAGGSARLEVLKNSRFEVAFEATLWGSVRDLREVVALAETKRLAPIEVEPVTFEGLGPAFDRLRAGDVRGRLVLTP